MSIIYWYLNSILWVIFGIILHYFLYSKSIYFRSNLKILFLFTFLSTLVLKIICEYILYLISNTNIYFFTANLLFILLHSLYFVYFLSAYLGEESPTGKILNLLEKKKSSNFIEILKLFDEKKVINSRLDELIRDNFIYIKNQKLVLTKKGYFIFTLIKFIRKLFNITYSG